MSKNFEFLRLAALERYKIMDTGQEEDFDHITSLAASICGTEISAISLIDDRRQWFKSRVGISVSETPIEEAFCRFTIEQDSTLVIADAAQDPRVRDHVAVKKKEISFYAGVPLTTPEGIHIGTLCVADAQSRSFTPAQENSLKQLARLTMSLLEARAESEELLKERQDHKMSLEIINASPDFIGTWDLQGKITHYNRTFFQTANRQQSDDFLSYFSPTAQELIQQTAMPEAIRKGFWRGESSIIDKNNREIPVLQTVVCHKDENGEPQYFSTIMHDISLLKENFLQFQTLSDLAPVGIYVLNRDGDPIYVNKRWLAMTGIEEDELANNSLEHIFPEDIHLFQETWIKSIQDKKDFELEFRMLNVRTKEVVFVQSRAKALKNLRGEVRGYIGATLDISAQKELELKLQKIVVQLGNFISNLPAAVAMLDKDLRYLAVSRRWIQDYGLEHRGYNAENVIGELHTKVMGIERSETKINFQRALRGEVIKKEDDRFTRFDGSIEWVNWDLRPWFDENGEIGGLIILTEVITEKKNAEVAILKANAEALRASNAKAQFLANMSHEIRTPLNSIIGLTELLAEAKLPSDVSNYVNVIYQSGEMLLSLINNILDLSKIEASQLQLEQLEVDIEDLTAKAINLFSHQAREKKINLHYDIPSSLSTFKGDPFRLSQILVNLLGNAVKFTDHGRVTLTAKPNDLPDRKGNLLFSVKDTGLGIDKNKHQLIFENFGQAETYISRKYGGSGLGLAITKNLVNLMGGEIWLESSLGKGSTFYFTLDLPVEQTNLGSEKTFDALPVLVHKADIESEQILENHLRELHIRYRRCETLQELLTAQESGQYSAILSDMVIKAPGTPLIFLSLGNEEVLTEERENFFPLLKPFSRRDLLTVLISAVPGGRSNLALLQEGEKVDELTRRNLRILIVDDSPENRSLMIAFLKKYPFEVVLAENGRDALELLKEQSFDIVFMDVQMPEMDGLTATRLFRRWEREKKKKKTPIVALTAFALQEEMKKSLEAGCDFHLSKPVKKATILDALRNLNSGH